MEEGRPSADHRDTKYKDFLKIHLVDIGENHSRFLRFSVSQNFTIFITDKSHRFLASKYGVEQDETLIEGYIYFDTHDKIREQGEGVSFKSFHCQSTASLIGGQEELDKLKSAVADMIRNAFKK